jgi:hypothetical protein
MSSLETGGQAFAADEQNNNRIRGTQENQGQHAVACSSSDALRLSERLLHKSDRGNNNE